MEKGKRLVISNLSHQALFVSNDILAFLAWFFVLLI
jgi:hypothetical protein